MEFVVAITDGFLTCRVNAWISRVNREMDYTKKVFNKKPIWQKNYLASFLATWARFRLPKFRNMISSQIMICTRLLWGETGTPIGFSVLKT
jgi:hypothetical protein